MRLWSDTEKLMVAQHEREAATIRREKQARAGQVEQARPSDMPDRARDLSHVWRRMVRTLRVAVGL